MKLVVLLYVFERLIAYSTAVPRCNDFKLELVQILLRHGMRTPSKKELGAFRIRDLLAYGPWGTDELTDEGKQQEYNFGKFLRKRYANYLSSTYKSEDVYAYASDTTRTKMSLSLVLAGLYPPVDRAESDKYISWNPIPYVSAPSKLDILLKAYENPKLLQLYYVFFTCDEYAKTVANYTEFFGFIADKTGSERSSYPLHAMYAAGLVMSHEKMNLPLPDWCTPEVRQKFREVRELAWDVMSYTPEMKRLMVGSLIKTFIDNMNRTTSSKRKIYLYGGHDANIAAFTRAHNIQEFRNPLFGSAVIFEKLRDVQANQTYVRLFAWDGYGELTALKLNGTEECMSTDKYLELVELVQPSEEEMDELLGSYNSTQIRNLLFKN